MRQALLQAVKVIKQWHGDEVFDIYYNHSPEMKMIREALGGTYDDVKDEPIEVKSIPVKKSDHNEQNS